MSGDISLLLKYFPDLNKHQQEQFKKLQELYSVWNERINVISRKDIDALYERHVLHSLAIAKFIRFKPGSKIIDVGCGGGFPGVPLAIFFPEVEFLLVDSIGKKINVVKEVTQGAGIKNIVAVHSRTEAIKGQFDFAVSRAVAPMSDLKSWTKHLISKTQQNGRLNGVIALKGGDLTEELKPFSINNLEVEVLSTYFKEEFYETKKVVYLSC